jgi:translation elongation factor EF-1beta
MDFLDLGAVVSAEQWLPSSTSVVMSTHLDGGAQVGALARIAIGFGLQSLNSLFEVIELLEGGLEAVHLTD